MTYYKYADREASSQIDWSEISKGISSTLLEEQKLREEKKAALEKSTGEYAQQLQEVPLSDNATMKTWWLNTSDDLQQAKLINLRLLKDGKMKLRDYNIRNQNLMDGTNALIDAQKKFNEAYKIKRERLMSQNPDDASQLLEQWEMEQLEEMKEFYNTKVYFDPTTYAMQLAVMEPKIVDGKEVMTMSDRRVSINQILQMLGSKYDKFNVDKALKEQEAMLGEYTSVITEQLPEGTSIVEYSNPAKRGELDAGLQESFNSFDKYLTNMIGSYLSNPYNVSSILTNSLDEGYNSFTYDVNDKDPKKILLRQTSAGLVPVFEGEKGEKQKKAAEDFMRGKFMNMIDVKEDSARTLRKPTPRSTGSTSGGGSRPTQGQISAEAAYERIKKLFTGGTESEIASTIKTIQGWTGNFKGGSRKIERTDTGVVVSGGDLDKPITFDFGDDPNAFVGAIYSTLIPSLQTGLQVERIVNNGGKASVQPTTTGGVVGERADERGTGLKTTDYISNYIKSLNFNKDKPFPSTKAEIADIFNKALAPIQKDGEQLIKAMTTNFTEGEMYFMDANDRVIGDRYFKVGGVSNKDRDAAIKDAYTFLQEYIDGLDPQDQMPILMAISNKERNAQYNK
jgi:hypothetical protein